jgi:Ca2+-binding EF-hand superfamily protein
MDANQNGTLEPGEVSEDRKRMLTFIAGRAGLDASKPIEISKVREKLAGGGQDENRSDDSKDSKSEKEKNEDPLVPGFGVAQEYPRVPRFGERVAIGTVTTSASSSGRSEGSGRGRDSERSREDRTREWAGFMLRRYDENNSGSLEKNEWNRLRERGRNPEEYDRNNDGVITTEEIAGQMAQFSRGGGPRSDSNGSGTSSDSDGNQATSYRFLTAAERLPFDIPDWFVDQDENGDGQVAMAEYASFWSDSKVREFARYDLNRDGLITPTECLAAALEEEDDESDEASNDGEEASEAVDDDKSDKGSGGGAKAWWMN